MRTSNTLLTLAAVLSVAGCTQPGFFSEAGSSLDTGDFGNPTMNNELVATGQKSQVVNLSRRFAAEAPNTINFAFNSAALDASAQSALRQQAEWIKQFPYVKFRVYGHTDKVGSNAYNKRLGLRRARAAVNYLVRQGISRSRLEAVVSFGETQPLIVSEGRERRNRRTVTEVSGFLKGRPQRWDGKYALATYTEYVTSATEPHDLVVVAEDGAAEER